MLRRRDAADRQGFAILRRRPAFHFPWDANILLALCRPRTLTARIAIGIVAGLAVLVVRAALLPVLGQGELLTSLFPVLFVATVAGGTAAGAVCLPIGLLGGWYWFMGTPRSFALAPFEGAALIGALVAGLALVWLCNRLRESIIGFQHAVEHEQILADELAHRIKNLLQLVTTIARHTFTDQARPEDAREEFEGRIAALAGANIHLFQAHGGGTELRDIIISALAPFSGSLNEDRLCLRGPSVVLTPEMTIPLLLAIHELATNATKYGALSVPAGKVNIDWTFDPATVPSFHLNWEETGGPEVHRPSRRGFGSELIERNLARKFRGNVDVRFLSKGLKMTLAA